jgi:hypothetical protein
MKERMDLTVELYHIMEEEELIWFKRSHETWLLKGDNNTKYFHRIANGKRENMPYFIHNLKVGLSVGHINCFIMQLLTTRLYFDQQMVMHLNWSQAYGLLKKRSLSKRILNSQTLP